MGMLYDQIWPPRVRTHREAPLRSAGRQSRRSGQPCGRVRSYPRAGRRDRVEVRVPAFYDIDDFLAQEDIDAVAVLTPSGMHPEHVIACAKAGKHVVVEKPMALRLQDADDMIRACVHGAASRPEHHPVPLEPEQDAQPSDAGPADLPAGAARAGDRLPGRAPAAQHVGRGVHGLHDPGRADRAPSCSISIWAGPESSRS